MEHWQLAQRQSLPLESKIQLSHKRIEDWYAAWDGSVCISTSGGKDSSVLHHLVTATLGKIPTYFVNTGLEYPENVKIAKQQESIILRPKKLFADVIKEYGYPIVSKRVCRAIRDIRGPNERKHLLSLEGLTPDGRYFPMWKLAEKWKFLVDAPFKISEQCCDWLKKKPLEIIHKSTGQHPFVGILAEDSLIRRKMYLEHGCNAFTHKSFSMPLGFWTQQDILQYIQKYNIPISSIYGDIVEKDGKLETTGLSHTGCMFCLFGIQYEKDNNRFQRMLKTHPKLHKYCLNKLGMREVLEFLQIPYE